MNDRPAALPHLIVRVAVTGHRDIAAAHEPAIRASILAILEAVLSNAATLDCSEDPAYSPNPPALRILSSLAEGADRLVAEEALALKPRHAVTLECPLPAGRDEYRDDFKTPASQQAFDDLLGQATAVFELDGKRDGEWLRSSDYRRAGHIAVSNCDLLIAIWDGDRGAPGGTAEIAQEAMHQRAPVVRIDVNNPWAITVCAHRDQWESDWQCALVKSLLDAFLPPADACEWVRHYCGEKIGAGARDVARPDKLATLYGWLYRASYRVKYILSACAVTCAVWGLALEPGDNRYWPALELVCILGILSCFAFARLRRWHDRWLDYRLLAEQFRVFDFLRPLGEAPPVFRPPAYWGGPKQRHAGIHWYFRARLREFGIPHTRVDSDYTKQRRHDVLTVTRDQLKYNRNKHKSMDRLHRFLEWGGLSLFGFTAAACLVHAGGFWDHPVLLGALTAALPAFGAAMEGLQAQEEAKRIEGFTGAMSQHLEEVEKRIKALPGDSGLGAVSVIAFDLATEMTWEASGWHNLIHGQPPKV